MAGRKMRKAAVLFLALLILAAAGYFLVTEVVIPRQKYAAADAWYAAGKFSAAEEAFAALGNYGDAAERVLACRDAQGMAFVKSEDYGGLERHIQSHGLSDGVREHICETALAAIGEGKYPVAFALISFLPEDSDAREQVSEGLYLQAITHWDRGEYEISDELFTFLGSYKDSADKIHVHEFILNTTTAPTCEEEGAEEYLCHCGAGERKPIPAAGHEFSAATCTQAPQCGVCGKTDGAPAPHDYSPATCTKGESCTVCAQAGAPALGHNMQDCVCRRCGKVELTLAQLQGTWVHSEGHTTIVISGDSATVYWHAGGVVYTGPVCLRDYGFYIEGTYESENLNGDPYTAKIRDTCIISKFTSTYFVDTFDDRGPFIWYKQ